MILDKQMELSAAQAVTVTAQSTNVLDLGAPLFAGHSNGTCEPIGLLITCDESFTAVGAATLAIEVRSSKLEDRSDAVVHFVSRPIGKAELVAGKVVPFRPFVHMDARRYVDVNFVVATGPMTAGKLTIRGVAARDFNLGS